MVLCTNLMLCLFFENVRTADLAISRNCNRFGPHAWLVIANIMTETIICFKFGRDEFPNPAPRAVKIFWVIFLTFLVAYPVWQFWYVPKREKRARKSQEVQHTEKSE